MSKIEYIIDYVVNKINYKIKEIKESIYMLNKKYGNGHWKDPRVNCALISVVCIVPVMVTLLASTPILFMLAFSPIATTIYLELRMRYRAFNTGYDKFKNKR